TPCAHTPRPTTHHPTVPLTPPTPPPVHSPLRCRAPHRHRRPRRSPDDEAPCFSSCSQSAPLTVFAHNAVDLSSACQALPLTAGVDLFTNENAEPDAIDDEYEYLMADDCLVTPNTTGGAYTNSSNTPSVYFDFMTYPQD